MIDLSTLNPPQREAVTWGSGPVLVLAGAGSGKTRVITHRIAWLIARGVRAESIVGLTFTNKAANEMRERLSQLIDPSEARRVRLSTFHSLGAALLREEIETLGYLNPFTIVDESDRERIIKRVLEELKLTGTSVSPDRILAIISKAKNAMTTPAKLAEARFNPDMPRAQRVFEHYERALRNLNAVDFDDLLLLPTRMFEQHPELRAKYRMLFRHVLVDEYQDTNPIQLELLDQIVAPPERNLMVVGDDDQSIYGFRGAVADNILRFEKAYAGAHVISLEQNYRSVSTILDAANAVIGRNAKRKAKRLWSERGTGEKLLHHAANYDEDEAAWIAERIQSWSTEQSRPLDAFAVLFRAGMQAREVEEALRARRLPYRLVGAQSLFDRKEVKDALAYLRLLLNIRDELAVRRIVNVPSRGVGTQTLADLDRRSREESRGLFEAIRSALSRGGLQARARESLREFVDRIDAARAELRRTPPGGLRALLLSYLQGVGLERAIRADEQNPTIAEFRWKTVLELIEGIGRTETPSTESAFALLDRYVQAVTLDLNAVSGDRAEDLRGKVTLMTLHASKGLEFAVVFMCGMSEQLLPHRRAVEEGGGPAIAEERRLCYVGMTRARERLVLTRARYAVLRGERVVREPSRFLSEIPPALVTDAAGGPIAPARVAGQPDAAASSRDQFEAMKALLASKSGPVLRSDADPYAPGGRKP
jgi:DNA helicase-2/ATP-dependent DNA helicase PcrA